MKNAVEEKSFTFAVRIVNVTRELSSRGCERSLTDQLMRSGTSIGANISEAQYAQSKKDFISKMSIALKEASETKYWIRLLRELGNLSEEDAKEYLYLAEELIRMLIAILKSSKEES